MTRKLVLFTLVLPLMLGCRSAQNLDSPPEPTVPKNVILFIGDGMGTTHFTVLHQLRESRSTLPRFTSSAMVTTHSHSSDVTDSGAAATAMATGIKTTNGALSVTPAGEEVETVLEIAEAHGMRTGLVSTTRFWDATPAAFAAHSPTRRDTRSLVEQMLTSGVDLIISNGAERLARDDLPPVEELAAAFGYRSITSADGLVPMKGKVLAMFPGDRLDLEYPEAPLPTLTTFALEHLSGDPDGFFLMIESEATDTTSHRNETEHLLDSLRSLDEAVSLALDWAEENGETLVLYTGDHEAGAFQISRNSQGETALEWFSGYHTGQALPLFAYGPGSERFTGWIDNTDIGKWLKEIVEAGDSRRSSVDSR